MLVFISFLLARVDPGGGAPAGSDFMSWDQCMVNGVATLQCIPIVLKNVVTAAIIFSGAVALVLIILSGIKFITSKGDQKQVDTAKKTLTYSIAGLIIILLSFFIIQVIGYVTGASCINAVGFNNCQ